MIWEIHGNSIDDERDNTRFRTMLLERDWAWSHDAVKCGTFILESMEVEVDKPFIIIYILRCCIRGFMPQNF